VLATLLKITNLLEIDAIDQSITDQ